jgi:hypothetical protein
MSVEDLMQLEKEKLARHAQEGWDLANLRTAQARKAKEALKVILLAHEHSGCTTTCWFPKDLAQLAFDLLPGAVELEQRIK